jgi:hypothetical protein
MCTSWFLYIHKVVATITTAEFQNPFLIPKRASLLVIALSPELLICLAD